MLPNISQKYDQKKFHDRSSEIEKATKWFRGPKKKKLLLVTGSPKAGKTWFLNHLQNDPKVGDDLKAFIDLGKCINQETGKLNNKNLCVEAKRFCTKVEVRFKPEWEAADDEPVIFEHIFEELSQKIFPQPCFVFIDGVNKLSEANWKSIQEIIVHPLLQNRNIYGVLAFHDRLEFQGIRRDEHGFPLTNLERHDAQQQILTSATAIIDFNQLSKKWALYDWSHPGINRFILEVETYTNNDVSADSWLKFNNAESRREFLHALIEKLECFPKNDIQEISKAVEHLCKIADTLDLSWAPEDLAIPLDISEIEAKNIVEELMDSYLVELSKDAVNEYQIFSPICQLIKQFHVSQSGGPS